MEPSSQGSHGNNYNDDEDVAASEISFVLEGTSEPACYFDLLPNELVAIILQQWVPPLWQVPCTFVCRRWHLLLRPVVRSLSAAKTRALIENAFDLRVLQWACWNETPVSHTYAREGHLEVLKWARSQGCPWNETDICCLAARGGHLDVLQWARSQGCPLSVHTCAYAAEGGHLEVLQWLRSQGCPWDEWTCTYAALGGHLEVLQWARGQGCPWDEGFVPLPLAVVCDSLVLQQQQQQQKAAQHLYRLQE